MSYIQTTSNPLDKFRGKLLRIYLILGITVTLLLLPLSLYFGIVLGSIAYTIFPLVSGLILWQYNSGRINRHRATHIFLASVIVLMLFITHVAAEMMNNTVWLVLFPVMAYSLNTTRTGLNWSIVAIVTALAVLVINLEFYSVASVLVFIPALLTATFAFHIFFRYNESSAAELMASKEKYQGIFDESVAAIYVFDHEKNFMDSNKAGVELLGYSRDELLNMNIADVDADHGAVVPAHKHLLSGGRIVNFEHRLVHKDGRILTVLNNSRPLTDTKGEVTGMQSTLIDITERNKSEVALKKANIVVENSPVVLFCWEAAEGWPVEFVSSNVSQFGYSAQELMSGHIPFSSIVHPDDLERVAQEVAEYSDAGVKQYNQEYRIVSPTGDVYWLDDRTMIERNADGKIIHYQGVTIDITWRKQAEKEREILQRELQHSQKMESLGHLTGGIAHEFNNLLGVINGFAELAITKCINSGDEKLLKYTTNIETAGKRASNLVAQMLSFSRSEKVYDVPLKMSLIIRENIDLLRSTLPSTIEIETIIDPHLPSVLMNPTQVKQILMNLSVNARDAMDGVGKLTIQLHSRHGLNAEDSVSHKLIKGDWIELTVSDTGSGIEPEIVENIFNPFFTTKEVGAGAGMGLSVIYRIMKDHGGHILLESEPGKGTTFRLLLPPIVNEVTVNNNLAGKSSQLSMGDGSEILIVDDEKMLALHMSELVKNRGYKAYYATDSTDALNLFKDDPDRFSILITDQTMPKMTGKELIEELRAIRPELPAILCSGYSDKISSEEASELDISYFSKPVDVNRLMKEVSNLLIQKNKLGNIG